MGGWRKLAGRGGFEQFVRVSGVQIAPGFFCPIRPADFDAIGNRAGPEAEVKSGFVLGEVAAAACQLLHEGKLAAGHRDSGPEGGAIRAGASE